MYFYNLLIHLKSRISNRVNDNYYKSVESLFVFWDKLCHNTSSESCGGTRVNMSAYYATTLAVNERRSENCDSDLQKDNS